MRVREVRHDAQVVLDHQHRPVGGDPLDRSARSAPRPRGAMPAVGSSSSIISGSSASVVAISERALAPVGSSTAGSSAKPAESDGLEQRARATVERRRGRRLRAPEVERSAPPPLERDAHVLQHRSGAGTPPRSGTSARSPVRAMSAGAGAGDVATVEDGCGRRVGARNCVSRLKQVVLPAPLGPMSAWIVPRRTRRSTPLTATKPRNSLVSPLRAPG